MTFNAGDHQEEDEEQETLYWTQTLLRRYKETNIITMVSKGGLIGGSGKQSGRQPTPLPFAFRRRYSVFFVSFRLL